MTAAGSPVSLIEIVGNQETEDTRDLADAGGHVSQEGENVASKRPRVGNVGDGEPRVLPDGGHRKLGTV
jgi:hypothetical protein